MRRIEPASNRKRGDPRGFFKALIGVVFWIVIAIVFPFQSVPDFAPGLAPYVPWLPYIAYALVLWNGVSAARALGRLANGWMPQANQSRQSPGRPTARNGPAVAIKHVPTVQRRR